MKRIGLFGGSFNPPHLGHLQMARAFVRELALNRLYIMPAGQPPHKPADEYAAGDDRLTMCRLLFTDPQMEVSSLELERTGKSYTIDTLEALSRLHPQDELFLCMGADMYLTLDSWKDFPRYAGLARFAAVSRGQGDLASLQEKEKNLPGSSILLKTEIMDISSSEIRKALRKKEDISQWVHPAVVEYIYKHELYVSDSGKKERVKQG